MESFIRPRSVYRYGPMEKPGSVEAAFAALWGQG